MNMMGLITAVLGLAAFLTGALTATRLAIYAGIVAIFLGAVILIVSEKRGGKEQKK